MLTRSCATYSGAVWAVGEVRLEAFDVAIAGFRRGMRS